MSYHINQFKNYCQNKIKFFQLKTKMWKKIQPIRLNLFIMGEVFIVDCVRTAIGKGNKVKIKNKKLTNFLQEWRSVYSPSCDTSFNSVKKFNRKKFFRQRIN